MSATKPSRDRWSSRSAFVLAAIGSAVGLGNVIVFPGVCYANGGGAFFIPYLVALFTAGIPLLILEFGAGQMTQLSAPGALKKLNKHTEWVGWFALLVATVICLWYSVLMAWAAQYLYYAAEGFFNSGQVAWASTGIAGGEGNFFLEIIRNDFTTETTASVSDLWTYHWPVIVGLVVVWLATYVIICRGVHRVGKVVMWTVPLPVIVLAVLIIRGVTLPGASAGISDYLTPDLSKLSDPNTWLAAYGQVFFSLTIGFGVMIAYASYRPKDSDITNNAFITALGNCATSFIAGFAVFSVVGFLQHQNIELTDIGTGLAFVTYPTAITEMGGYWTPIIGVIFFLMLLLLGIDSIFSLVEAAVAGLRDRYPWITQNKLSALFCFFGLVVSIIFFANRAGFMWEETFSHWTNKYGLVLVGLLQCLIVGYFYKTDKLRDYINKVSEIKLWGWWELCIRIITPTILIFLLSYSLLKDIDFGKFPGVSEAGDSIFDSMAKVPAIIFAGLFAIAFAMAKMWSYLLYIAGGVVVFFLVWWLLGETAPAIFCGLATAILLGGLIHCLMVARKGEVAPDPE